MQYPKAHVLLAHFYRYSYSPDTSESFIPNLVHSVYTTPTAQLLPHRLSLFLMVLAMGTAVDLEQPHRPQDAERYHQLARAALCETSVLHDPSIDTINALVSLGRNPDGLSTDIRPFSSTWYGICSCSRILRRHLSMHGGSW